nr:iron-sulfur cluster assembly protein [Pseudophaeobacter leonis]
MSVTQKEIQDALGRLVLPDGGTLISRDMIRALTLQKGEGSGTDVKVSFVIEAPSPAIAQHMEPLRRAAEAAVLALEGVGAVSAALTAHGPAAPVAAPSLKIGGHPKPQAGPVKTPRGCPYRGCGIGQGGRRGINGQCQPCCGVGPAGAQGWTA